jgi:hypothetical protein
MKTADPPEALIALSGQIHLFSQNQSRPAFGLARALDYRSRKAAGDLTRHQHEKVLKTRQNAVI